MAVDLAIPESHSVTQQREELTLDTPPTGEAREA